MLVKNVQRFIFFIAFGVSAILGITSIVLVRLDPNFHNVWLPFWMHIISFLGICLVFATQLIWKKHVFAKVHEKELLIFAGIVLLAALVSFFMLIQYPYVSVGDELRDSGLYAQQIANGQIQNIFGYGAYDGYGLIISAIASLFYKVFTSSVLTYRFPAAIVAFLDITILYILLRQITKQVISFLGATILAVLPMHLFFARTQLVVAFNSFWTTVILFATYFIFESESYTNYIFLGAVLGFASQFHATARVIAILIFLLVVCFKCGKVFQNKLPWKSTLIGLVLLIIFAVISFGPQLLFSNAQNFLHTGRFVLQNNIQSGQVPSFTQLTTIGQNYLKSLGAWIVTPVGGDFFHDDQPLVPFFFVPIFLLGILYSVWFVRKTFLYILLFLVFLVPFFSSAITDGINMDHRMNSTLPIVALFCSIGMYVVLRLIKNHKTQIAFLSLVTISIVFLGSKFFLFQTANIGREVHDYMSMNIIYSVQDQLKSINQTLPIQYCLIVSKNNSTNLDYLHYKEQYEYFLPNVTVDKQIDTSLPDSEVYVFQGTCPVLKSGVRREVIHNCGGTLDYLCPINFKGELKLYFN